MHVPEGLEAPPTSICHLRHSSYGLKQAPRAWFENSRKTIINSGFKLQTKSLGSFMFLFNRHLEAPPFS